MSKIIITKLKQFWLLLKKWGIEFTVLFFGIWLTLYVQKAEDDYDRTVLYYELANKVAKDLKQSLIYTEEYIEQTDYLITEYHEQYKRWTDKEIPLDSVFVVYYEEDDYYHSPMSFFDLLDPFNPPVSVGDQFKGNDPYFNDVNSELSLVIQNILYGTDLKYLKQNTGDVELKIIEEWKILKKKWVMGGMADYYNIDFRPDFWIINAKKIRKDREAKYLLFRRLNQWDNTKELLIDWKESLESDIKILDSLNSIQDKKIYLIYWEL
tara:strand:- start:353 stop:1150 length:798 start_codon:yes stop_codon:yes gene_type:complete